MNDLTIKLAEKSAREKFAYWKEGFIKKLKEYIKECEEFQLLRKFVGKMIRDKIDILAGEKLNPRNKWGRNYVKK